MDEEFSNEDSKLDNKRLLLQNLKRSKILSSEMLNAPLESFRTHLIEELKKLNTQESVLLNGGWSGKPSGHAMLYGIQKDNTGKFTLTIYNTGGGLEKHTSFEQEGKSFALPVKEIEDVTLDDLTSYTTLHALKQLVELPIKEWNADKIYKVVFKEVGGKVSTKEYSATDLFLPQFSGTCSYRVLTSYLHHIFSNKALYYRIDFKIKLKTLVDYYNAHKFNDFVDDEKKRKLVQKATTFFSKEVLGLYGKSIITDEEFDVVTPLLGNIQSDMEFAEKEAISKYSKGEVDRSYAIEKGSENGVLYPLKLPDFNGVENNSGTHLTSYLDRASVNFALTQENFQTEFEHFFSHVEALYNNNELDTALESLRELTSRLGFDNNIFSGQINIEKSINQMGEEELFQLGSKLNRYSHILIKSLLRNSLKAKTLDPALYLSQMKIVAALDLAMNRFCHLKGLSSLDLFPREMRNILTGKNTYFLFFNPREEAEFSQLQLFLRDKKPIGLGPSFFESDQKQSLSVTIKEDDFQTNSNKVIPCFKWDYLRTKEFQDKFYSHYGTGYLDLSSDIERVSKVFPFYYGGFTRNSFQGLPNLFYDARETVTISSYLLTSPLQLEFIGSYSQNIDQKQIQYRFLFKENEDPVWSADVFSLCSHNAIDNYVRDEEWKSLEDENNARYILPHVHFRSMRKPISLYSIVGEEGSLSIDENQMYCPNDALQNGRISGNIKSIGHQNFKELSSLYLEKRLQIINALGFFKESLMSLKDPSYQGSFEQLIFEPNVLLKELTYSKEQTVALLNQFQTFLKEGYDLFSSLKDYDSAFFFLETSVKISRYVRYVKEQHPNMLSSEFDENLLEVSYLIENAPFSFKLTKEQIIKSKALLAINLADKKNPTVDELVTIFSSYIYYQSHLESNIDKSLHFNLKRSIEKQLINLKRILEQGGEKSSKFVNQVLKKAFLNQKDHQWKSQSNLYFVTDDSELSIDFKKGIVRFKGSLNSNLEVSITEDPLFKKFFPDAQDLHVVDLGGNKYELTTSEGIKYRVIKGEKGNLSLQRLYNNKWFQLFDPKASSKFDDSSAIAQTQQWQPTPLNSALDYLYSFFQASSLKHFRLPAYFFSRKAHMFFSEDFTEAVSFNSVSHLPEYKLNLQKGSEDQPLYGEEIMKLAPNGEELGVSLIDLGDTRVSDLFFLNRFESRDYTLIWRENKTNSIKSIEFPRCGLDFTASKQKDGEALFLSKQYRGFFISKNQFVEDLGDYGHYLVLENQSGKRVALFPDKPLVKPQEASSSLQTHHNFKDGDEDYTIIAIPINSNNAFQYDKLSLEQKFYLAKIFLSEQRYDRCLELINFCYSSISPYTSKEFKLLKELITSSHLNDHDPRSFYLRVKASTLLVKNLLDFLSQEVLVASPPDEVRDLMPTILSNCMYYMKTKSPFDQNVLSVDEEKGLLQLLTPRYWNLESVAQKKTLFVLERLKQIDPEKYDKALNSLCWSYASKECEESKECKGTFDDRFEFSSKVKASCAKAEGSPYFYTERLKRIDPTKGDEVLSLPFIQKGYNDKKFSDNLVVGDEPKPIFESLRCSPWSAFVSGSDVVGKTPFLILQPVITKEKFRKSYTLVKDQALSKKELQSLFTELFQITLPDSISSQALEKEVKKAFRLMYLSSLNMEDKVSQCRVQVLYAVFSDKDSFPTTQEVLDRLPDESNYDSREEQQRFFQGLISKSESYYKDKMKELSHEKLGEGNRVKLSDELALSRKSLDLLSSAKSYLSKPPNTLYMGEMNVVSIPTEIFEPLELSSSSSLNHLEQLKLLNLKDPLLKNEMDTISEAHKSYQDSIGHERQLFRVRNMEEFKGWIGKLSSRLKVNNGEVFELEIDILKLANQVNPSKITQRTGEIAAKAYNLIGLKEAKLLFLKRNLGAYQKRNPELSESDSEKLDSLIQDYLLYSTYSQHLQRVIDASNLYVEKSSDPSLTEKELAYLVQDLMKIALEKRHYGIIHHPEYLVFEEALGILLYEEQVKNIEKLVSDLNNRASLDSNIVLEMMVGSGKTYILAPLIAKRVADGKKLSMLVLPEALFPSMSREIEQSLNSAFRQEVQSFQFDRKTKLSSKDLEWIYQQIELCISEEKVLMMTPKSIQSFYLMAIDTLYKYANCQDMSERFRYEDQIRGYRKIFKVFKEKGNLLIDEIDTVLHPLKEHHFTFEKQKPELDLIHHAADIYKSVVREVFVQSYIPQYGKDKAQIVSMETYHRDIKGRVIESLLKGDFIKKDKKLLHFMKLFDVSKKSIKSFFLNENNSFYELLQKAPSEYDYVKNKLALAKEMVETLLPMTLSKQVNEHFGLSKRDTHVTIAIPYHGSNHPAEGSRFGTLYETMNYTYQYYLKKGIPKELILKTTRSLINKLSLELKEKGTKDIEKTDAFKLFQKFASKAANVNHFIGIDKNIGYIEQLVNQNPSNIVSFVERFILPQMDVYSKHIRVGSQLYSWMFNEVNGFTGTLWNFDTFPEGMKAFPSAKATGKILSLLLEDSFDDVHVLKKNKNLDQLLTDIFSSGDIERSNAIIDVGAYFRGHSNFEIASAILDNESVLHRKASVKGAIFYDENGNLKIMKLKNGKKQINDYIEGLFPKENLITFYDQKHTTGSNIPQAVYARGIVTVGPHIKVRDLIQAVGRMRRLDKGQKAGFVVSEDVRSLLKVDDKVGLNLNDILNFAVKNQAYEKGNNNFRAFKSKLDSSLEFSLMDQLMMDPLDISESQKRTLNRKFDYPTSMLKTLLENFKSYFVFEEENKPFKQFGGKTEKVERNIVMGDLLKRFEKGSDWIKSLGIQGPKIAEKELLENFYSRQSKVLPLKLSKRDTSYQFEVETEVETKVETKVEMEKETEREEEYSTIVPNSCKVVTFPWKKSFKDQKPFPILLKDVSSSYTSDENPYLVRVGIQDAFKEANGFSKYASVFDPNLSCTQNIIPLKEKGEIAFSPFSFQMRSSNHALIIQEEGSDDLHWMMLDEKNAAILKELSSEEMTKFSRMNSGLKPHKIALYHLNLDEFSKRGDSELYALNLKELTSNPKFLRLKVQMKFYNGHIRYKEEEWEALSLWIVEKGVEKMKELFEKHILPKKDYNLRHYATSGLHKLFESLGSNG